MKKLFVITATLMLALHARAQQEEGMPLNTFWFNPTQMFRSEFNIGYERNFGRTRTQSIGLNGGFLVRGYASKATR